MDTDISRHPAPRRLTHYTRIQPATLFIPQDRTLPPEAHFPLQTVTGSTRPPVLRFINRFDSREILLVTDGSCINNGRHANKLQDPSGGCSFVFRGGGGSSGGRGGSSSGEDAHQPLAGSAAAETVRSGAVAFFLENHGPSGSRAEATSNRAKLRAVIAALEFRAWGGGGEGWRRVVVLTDLEYVVWGATRWLPEWAARRWRKPRGRGRYENRDLWEALQQRVEELRGDGCEVSFWLVRRGRETEWKRDRDGEKEGNGVIARAKTAAQRAARGMYRDKVSRFDTRLFGVVV